MKKSKFTDHGCAQAQPWGFGLCFLYLRNVKGFEWNHSLVGPMSVNAVWSMDFMHDQLKDGRSIRLLNVIDGFNREALGIGFYFSLPSARVIRALEQIMGWRGKAAAIL